MAESPKKRKTTAKPRSSKKKEVSADLSLKPAKKPRKPRVKAKAAAPAVVESLSVAEDLTTNPKIEESKFFVGPVIQKFIDDRGYDLPLGYNEAQITLMVRDPFWIHTYWELPQWKLDELKSLMGHQTFDQSKRILRVYDVTDVPKFTGLNSKKSFDLEVGTDSRNWYLNTGNPNRSWCIDIGYLTPAGKFYVAARSNVVKTPRETMSEVVDEEWMSVDWERLYALSGGLGIGSSSGEIREMLKKRLSEELSSGLFFGSSWGKSEREEKQKDFWLVANTELIVYGATDPSARLTVQGLPIKLRHDGTFTLRFALPDGKQEIPIVAKDKTGTMTRKITPIVEKRTH